MFVVHGRNEPARAALFQFLRAIGLEPLEWEAAIALSGKASPYIGDVLDVAFASAQAVVVLQTPDDVAYLHPSLTYPDDPASSPEMQPRPNVLFEAGMAMGRNPDRTLIIEFGSVRSFSDIHGRHLIRLDGSIARRQALAERLRSAGCAVSTVGTDWHAAGDLTPPAPPGGGLPLGRRLPASDSSGLPRLDATLRDNGGNRMSDLMLTNYGPGDLCQFTVAIDDDEGLAIRPEGLPGVLPHGKSVRVMRVQAFGQRDRTFFNLTVKGSTADGVPIENTIFISGA